MSAIACISMAGLLDVKTLKGTSDGDTFHSFIHTHLLHQLIPYNGTNPHFAVIMDNCSIHHVPEVVKSIQDVGALVHFLPHIHHDRRNIFLSKTDYEINRKRNHTNKRV